MKIDSNQQNALIAILIGFGLLVTSISGYFIFSDNKTSNSNLSSPKSSESNPSEVNNMSSSNGSSTNQSNASNFSESTSVISQTTSKSGPTPLAPTNTSKFAWPKPDKLATSSVKFINGAPKLFINSKQVPPIMFFGNTDMNARASILTEEFKKAAKGNIHLHSLISSPEIGGNQPPEIQYFDLTNDLDVMLAGDPDGFALLRVNVGKYYNTTSYQDTEIVKYNNPRTTNFLPMVSIASDLWFSQTKKMLIDMVSYIRKDPLYSKHVMGYHLDCGEWFQYMFRENGVDISPANTRKFKEWLTIKYKTDTALKNAWNNPLISINTAEVPKDIPGNQSGKPENMTLMLKSTDQRYVDYLDYISDLVSDRIEGLSAAIKSASNRENIVIAFYGYLFELADPQSGHFCLEKLLKSNNIDGFASPECYLDRNFTELFPKQPSGSTGAYMSPVDTIQRSGKLWFVESDQRTFINRADSTTEHDTYLVPIESVRDIIEVSKRDIGSNMIRGAAIWFMDLWAVGWLDDQEIWNANGKLAELYQAYTNYQKKAPALDVAFVVDEKAMSMVSQPTDSAWHFLSYQRYDFYRAGIKWGMFTMKDLYNGTLSQTKIIFILNPFRLSIENINKIKQAAIGKTIVLGYGFGNSSSSDIESLTGMKIIKDNRQNNLQMVPASGAADFGLSSKETFGADVKANPRWYVDSGADSIIGKYSDGKAGFAVKKNANYKTVFFGGMRIDTDVIRAIVNYAGNSNVFIDSDDVSMANENLFVLHSSKQGVKTIKLPYKCDVYDYFNNQWYMNVASFKTSLQMGQTAYYFYGKKSEIEAMKLPKW